MEAFSPYVTDFEEGLADCLQTFGDLQAQTYACQ